MDSFIEYLVIDKGLALSIVFLVLTLPVVATIGSFIRHVIGIRSFGVYTPIALTYAFYELGVVDSTEISYPTLGLKYGLTLILIVFASSTVVHLITKSVKLHYIPKMSLVLTGVVIAILVAMSGGAYFNKAGFISVDVLALLLVITISEQYINVYVNKDGRTAILLGIQTILIALISYILISWDVFRNLLLDYPFHIIIIAIILNIFVGLWLGLRLTEYIRFWDILTDKSSQEE